MKRSTNKFLSLLLVTLMTCNTFAIPSSATEVDEDASQQVQAVANDEVINETKDDSEVQPSESVQQDEGTDVTPEEAKEVEQPTIVTKEESFTTFTVNASEIEVSDVDVESTIIPSEEADVDMDSPTITVVEEELKTMTVMNEEGEKVPLTPEQQQQALYMFGLYKTQWEENANVLGVQNAFFLQFNDKEDGLGTLGEMLVMAGVTVQDVRDGNYKFDDLMGMINNFYYGDKLGIEYYGSAIASKRDEALKEVKESGAKTDAQKLLVLNGWLAENTTFAMAYIMNAEDPENPTMVAKNPVKHEHYDDVYNTVYAVYEDQIRTQFHDQIFAGIEAQLRQTFYEEAIKKTAAQGAMQQDPDMTEEEANAAGEQFVKDNAEAIAADAPGFVKETFGEEAATGIAAKADEFIEGAKTEGVPIDEAGNTATIEQMTQDQMANNADMDGMNGMTPNQAIPVYADQAAQGLTTGILGYWQGNHMGALADGKAVCLGYTKALAYLVQCMYPEYYGVNGANTDMTVSANWKKADDLYYDADGNLDVTQDYNVDVVRITFDADVSMYGVENEGFNSDHFWNAVKVDGQWYYIDPCYVDIWSEVMDRNRVETDGVLNHVYFLISHTSLEKMLEGNYSVIKGLYEEVATDKHYEDAWMSRAVSTVSSDGDEFYYSYDSSDMITMSEKYKDMMNDMGDMGQTSKAAEDDSSSMDMEVEDPVYKIVGHPITNEDKKDIGDEDYTTYIEFNYKANEDDKESVARIWNPSSKTMEENEVLTKLYAQFEIEKVVYPSLGISTAYYDGKLYFNLSNSIFSYELANGALTHVKEYNEVSAVRDDSVEFGALAFTTTSNEEEADLTVVDHPIAGISLENDGQLYVAIATNFGFISGKNPDECEDSEENGYGYEFEESNFNPDYNSYSTGDDSEFDMGSMGMEDEVNDNDEFMWIANFVDSVAMSEIAKGNLEDPEVVPCDHHYIKYDERYYTKDDDENWNTGTSYVCAICGYAIEEPTEPSDNQFQEATEEDWEEYRELKAIYDEAVAEAGNYTYTPADAEWSEDGTKVTFSKLEDSVCVDRKDFLDCLVDSDDIIIELKEKTTVSAKMSGYVENEEDPETVIATYVAEGSVEGHKYSVSTEVVKDKESVSKPQTPEVYSAYSSERTRVKVTWEIVEDVDGYQVLRATSEDAAEEDWSITKTIQGDDIAKFTVGDTIQYTNTGLEEGTTYYYKVRSFKNNSEDGDAEARVYSEYSEVVYTPAAVVFTMVYSNSTERIRLNWAKVEGACGYQLWRKGADGVYSVVKTIGPRGDIYTEEEDCGDVTAYSNTGLKAGETYTYKMRAYGIPEDGKLIAGTFSDEFTLAVNPEVPTFDGSSKSAGKADLAWSKENGASGYQVWMSTSKDGDYSIVKTAEGNDATSYTKGGLTSKNTYYFKVRAYVVAEDRTSVGEFSDVVSVKVK